MEAGTGTLPIAGELITRLEEICGTEHVLADPTTLATYRSDAQLRREQVPALAVLPGSAAEVADVVRACAERRTPWVARGAGTGLSGGALPLAGGVLIVLSRLRRILEVDLPDARVVVEPGVSNLAVSRAVAPTHFYPPDPGARRVCTLGGDVAENAGGPHGLKYGTTGDYVLGLDVVLPDGSLARLRRDQPGYDLVGAFVGSEGTLGIAVAIHLRVVPVPETVRGLAAYFDTAARAGEAVSRIVAAGHTPAAIALIDSLAIRAVEDVAVGGYRPDAGAALLIELDGAREDCSVALEEVATSCCRAGARDIRIALDPEERAALWSAQEAVYPAMRRVTPAFAIQDGVVPRSRLSDALERIAALSQEFGLPVAHICPAGQGTLHPIICFDPGSRTEVDRARELADRILDVCLEAGGSIAGEHGVGLDKRERMGAMYSAADLDAFARLRDAFDPAGLANPGRLLSAARG